MFPWEWRDWDQKLNGLFRPVRGIRSHQHFQLENSGDVIAKISCDSEQETRIPLLKHGVTTERVKQAELPTVITPPGISQERKIYLFELIQPHDWPEFRDITCPHP